VAQLVHKVYLGLPVLALVQQRLVLLVVVVQLVSLVHKVYLVRLEHRAQGDFKEILVQQDQEDFKETLVHKALLVLLELVQQRLVLLVVVVQLVLLVLLVHKVLLVRIRRRHIHQQMLHTGPGRLPLL
jgi:uncharacterized ion transporter superfamily protein YfcC